MPLTPPQEALYDAATSMRLDPESVERAVRELVQSTLRHANPGNVGAWTRHNRDLALTIQAKWAGSVTAVF